MLIFCLSIILQDAAIFARFYDDIFKMPRCLRCLLHFSFSLLMLRLLFDVAMMFDALSASTRCYVIFAICYAADDGFRY